MIRIRTPKPGQPQTISGTEFRTIGGAPVPGVTECVMWIGRDELIECELTIQVAEVDVEAHPLLDLSTVMLAAQYHGYRLVPMTEGYAA